MLIRYGYEMTFTCSAPTPMICQLDVHPSCVPAVRAETPFAATPHVESWLYADVFGNRCRRFNAPAGDLTISNAGVIEVSGLPDPVVALDRDGRVVALNERARVLAPALRQGEPVAFALRIPELIEAIGRAAAEGEEKRVVYFERDIAHAIAVLSDMLRRRVVRRHGRCQNEVRLALTHGIRGSLPLARFQSTVSDLRKTKALAVKERRLAGIADPEFDVVNAFELERIFHAHLPRFHLRTFYCLQTGPRAHRKSHSFRAPMAGARGAWRP